jgi:hypothetical protein
MRQKLLLALVLILTAIALPLGVFRHTDAATFNPNLIIDDAVFDNTGAMNVSQIDTFLNSFPNSCISTNNGFSAPQPIGYNPTQGFLYGSPVSAGQVIYESAQAYGLNPQVLLTTLQKEEGLVQGDGPYGCGALSISASAGYACTDSDTASHTYEYTNGTDPGTLSTPLYYDHGNPVNKVVNTCVNSPLKAGFTEQIVRATWLLKFGEQRSKGNINWAVVKGNWNNSDDPQSCYGGPMTQGTWARCPSGSTTYYDGYTTIDSTSVHMDDGATAALYWYTPHLHGNQSFETIFTGWFGSTTGPPYTWHVNSVQLFTDSSYSTPVSAIDGEQFLSPGQTAYVKVSATNIGRATWQSPNLRLGTYAPMDYSSIFKDSSWLSSNRIVPMNETSAAPNQPATFKFSIKAPATANSYTERYSAVAEGIAWLTNERITLPITVTSPMPENSLNPDFSLSNGQSMHPGDILFSPDRHSALKFDTNGNLVLYTNFHKVWESATAGSGAINLVNQTDGNLVLYSKTKAVWSSGTYGKTPGNLVMQTDGNVVLGGTSPTWSTDTTTSDQIPTINRKMGDGALLLPGQILVTPDKKYKLVLQADGNLVLYSPYRATWASGTYGKTPGSLVMQTDGNLVLYDASGHPVWSSNTYGNGLSTLVAQQDGNLVIYSKTKATWASGTYGKQ